jgi:hypothetical protein
MKTRRIGLSRVRMLCVLLVAIAVTLGMAALPARAQEQPCLPTQQDLVKIPEIATDGQGHLRGTIQLIDQQELIPYRIPLGAGNVPGGANTKIVCLPQFMRAYQIGGTPPPTGLANPLRPDIACARRRYRPTHLLNQINTGDFGN